MASGTHLSAAEAAAELGVSLPTLYAYVSRGLVRSEAHGRSRQRRYVAQDIWALKQRKEMRRDPAKAAESALHWGLPVLESRLALITDGHLYYRGHDVVGLATTASLEQVAALLWMGNSAAPFPDDLAEIEAHEAKLLQAVAKPLEPMSAFQLYLPLLAARDSSAYDLRPPAVRRSGAIILRLLAALAVHRAPSRRSIAATLQRGWLPRRPEAADLLQAALVLYADNGLSPSTFTARCAASAGSTPYAVVAAGLSALQGTKHGGASERAAVLLDEAEETRTAREAVASRLRRGEGMPGFGHPLYPNGDPRGALLMRLAAEKLASEPVVALALAIHEAVSDLIGEHPTVDFGVVTLCRALHLPQGAPLALLAIGRTVGWIAHALEQYEEGRLIRPKARYAGVPPVG